MASRQAGKPFQRQFGRSDRRSTASSSTCGFPIATLDSRERREDKRLASASEDRRVSVGEKRGTRYPGDGFLQDRRPMLEHWREIQPMVTTIVLGLHQTLSHPPPCFGVGFAR